MIPYAIQRALDAAAQRISAVAAATAERLVDTLGVQAMSATNSQLRQGYTSAQFELRIKLGAFNATFSQVLREKIKRAADPAGRETRSLANTSFESLSLVGDDEVEEQVSAERLSMDIQHQCEWELRELDSYVGSLLQVGRPDPERNPLRPEIVGQALFRGLEAVTTEREQRKLLSREMTRALSQTMRGCYAEIIEELRRQGIQPVGLAVRQVQGPGNDLPRETLRENSGYQTTGYPNSIKDTAQALQALSSMFGIAVPGLMAGGGAVDGSLASAASSLHGAGDPSTSYAAARGQSGAGGLTGAQAAAQGQASPWRGSDAQMLEMLRRLASLGALSQLGSDYAGGLDSRRTSGHGGPSVHGSGHGTTSGPMRSSHGSLSGAMNAQMTGLMAANLIRAHRDELVRASSGALDHMVIDVVAAMFDQVLSDSKVPPQMARQIARLQLPVLRAALKDVGFFHSRRHPVRRFVNRIASLAAAYEDFDEGPGKAFLDMVRDLVQQIVEGDFDQMDLYESKLQSIEALIQAQSARDVGGHAEAAAVLDGRETAMRIQQRYMRELKLRLAPIPLPDFLRDFLAQVWSQVQVHAAGPQGTPEQADRMRRAAMELALSVQPKGEPSLRKAFLLKLPQLMKDMNEGLALIRWPDEAKKAFFSQLLPAHADSLKGMPLSEPELAHLREQLDEVAEVPIPTPDDLAPATAPAELALPSASEEAIHVAPLAFSPEEAEQIGLVEEASVDWDGQVDIDVGEPGETPEEIDIVLDGPLGRDAPPTRGVGLLDYIQPGIAYRMHLEGGWQRVRLSWVSPGRAFFVFTHGKGQQKTISMTARMLARMCETERFRAFEQAELLERATLRARKQLAALSGGTRTH